MRRVAAAVALMVGACSHPGARLEIELPDPLPMLYEVAPHLEYARWLFEVRSCVHQIAAVDSGRTFKLSTRALVGVDGIRWVLATTERVDGAFACPLGWCWGLTYDMAHAGERPIIVLSGQRALMSVTVKHELMHVLVESGGEKDRVHGPPWGLCEWQ